MKTLDALIERLHQEPDNIILEHAVRKEAIDIGMVFLGRLREWNKQEEIHFTEKYDKKPPPKLDDAGVKDV